MALFQLDPSSSVQRIRTASATSAATLPTLAASLRRGVIGFTIVSVAGFLPWPIFDLWLSGMKEMHLYIACTAVFIGLSAPCLHRLILGPGSMSRFYKLFSLAFIAYAVVWIALWMAMRSDTGVVAGLLGGTAVMGAIFCFAFDAWSSAWKAISALFLLNTAGYFAGAKVNGMLIVDHPVTAMLLWGVFYGVGFGAGLGIAFHVCQEKARAILKTHVP